MRTRANRSDSNCPVKYQRNLYDVWLHLARLPYDYAYRAMCYYEYDKGFEHLELAIEQ